jgi:RNA polymerase sigma-70 factor (ECF subfamily)
LGAVHALEASLIQFDRLADLDDDVLAKQVIEDFDAFSELYQRYLCPIYRFVRSQVPSDSVAEDLTAQVFFKALNSAGTFRGDSGYAPWIFRIAHNAVSTWRRGKDRVAVNLEEVPERADETPCPASQVILGEARSVIWQKVSELPPAQREVVALRYIRDFSIEEVAGITDRSRGAVRILLHRARLKLRHALEGKDPR